MIGNVWWILTDSLAEILDSPSSKSWLGPPVVVHAFDIWGLISENCSHRSWRYEPTVSHAGRAGLSSGTARFLFPTRLTAEILREPNHKRTRVRCARNSYAGPSVSQPFVFEFVRLFLDRGWPSSSPPERPDMASSSSSNAIEPETTEITKHLRLVNGVCRSQHFDNKDVIGRAIQVQKRVPFDQS